MLSHSHSAEEPRALSALDRTRSPSAYKKSPHEKRDMLVRAVAKQLRLTEIPHGCRPKRWDIETESQSISQVVRAIYVRVRYADTYGFDVRSAFTIDDKSKTQEALHLAELTHLLRSGMSHPQTIPGHEDLIRLIGLPGVDVTHTKRWFRRALIRHARQMADYLAHLLRDIGKYASPIVCEEVLVSRKRQLEFHKEFARKHVMISRDPHGVERTIPFADVEANARKRTNKCYVRLKGLEKFCTDLVLVGYFLTLTLPPEFHPNPSRGRCSWNGCTPHEAHNHIQKNWRLIQRRFNEKGGKFYGVRVEEPHEDGCPHWHALIYLEASRADQFASRVSEFFGGQFAAKLVLIDQRQGSGASYLIKYLNPVFADGDRNKATDESTSEAKNKNGKRSRYDAHRATWGGRSIQFLDVPGSSTVWDEVRRIRVDSPAFALLDEQARALHKAATENDYASFLQHLLELHKRPLGGMRVLYLTRPKGSRAVRGLILDGVPIETRSLKWEIQSIPDDPRTVIHSSPRKSGNLEESAGEDEGGSQSVTKLNRPDASIHHAPQTRHANPQMILERPSRRARAPVKARSGGRL